MMGKVGQEVYLSLLRDAIEDAKGTEVTPVPLTRLSIPASKVTVGDGDGTGRGGVGRDGAVQ